MLEYEYDVNLILEEARKISTKKEVSIHSNPWNSSRIKRASDWFGNSHILQKMISKELGIKK